MKMNKETKRSLAFFAMIFSSMFLGASIFSTINIFTGNKSWIVIPFWLQIIVAIIFLFSGLMVIKK